MPGMVAEPFLHAAAAVAPLLRTTELSLRWAQPSALVDFQVSGLAGHLVRAVSNVERYLSADVPTGIASMDAVAYFLAANDPETQGPTIRERGEREAQDGPILLADRYDDVRARLASRLPGLPDDQPVLMFNQYVLPLRECLLTRLVELVVHADDLAVSLGVPTPDPGPAAADLVVTTLARLSRERHGTVAVLRALARRERAPSHVAAF